MVAKTCRGARFYPTPAGSFQGNRKASVRLVGIDLIEKFKIALEIPGAD